MRVRLDRPRKTRRGLAGLAPHSINNHLTLLRSLRALRWQDVDLERARIRVARTLTPTGFDSPKSRWPRTVKLGGDVVVALQQHPRHPASELVLCRGDGSPLSMAQVRGAVT